MKKICVALVLLASHGVVARTNKEAFDYIYKKRFWNDGKSGESVSGPGSTMRETRVVREELPKLFKKYTIKFFVDAPCGDFNWMKAVDLSSLEQYAGLDIVADLIAENNKKYASEKIHFFVCDIACDLLPSADLLLCRDCLQHMPNKDIMAFVQNAIKSGVRYLLVTTYKKIKGDLDIEPGDCRKVNVQEPPFNFPEPIETITEGFNGKSLCLWRVDDLPKYDL